MKGERFLEEKIISILKEAEAGVSVQDLCRKYGMSDGTFYNWKAKYGGLTVSEARRLRTLDAPVRSVARKVKSLPAGFTYQLLSKTIPSGAPKGEYELAVVFFDATKPYHGRADAFLDVSAKFTIQ